MVGGGEDEAQQEPNENTLAGFMGAVEHASGPDEIFAVQQKFKRKFGTNWRERTKRTTPNAPAAKNNNPTTATATARLCINCSSDKHPTNDCPLPRNDDKMECPKWHKTGHNKNQCPMDNSLDNVNDSAQLPTLGASAWSGITKPNASQDQHQPQSNQ